MYAFGGLSCLCTGIPQGSALTILHDHLKVKKLCAQWVQLKLNTAQKMHLTIKSELGLKLFRLDRNEFLQRFITVNEIWIYHIKAANGDSSEAADGSNNTTDSRPKQQRRRQIHQQSDDKVLATIFWDANGIIPIDYIETGITKLPIDQYNGLLDRLNVELNVKRSHLTQQNVLFHCGTLPELASVQSSKIRTKLKELKYDLLDHPQYAPDLDPSDFFFVSRFKRKTIRNAYTTGNGNCRIF